MENNLKQLPERFSVYAKTLEEAKYIVQKQGEICGESFDAVDDTYYRFSPKDYDNSGYSTTSYLKDEFLLKDYEIEHEFTFEEFKSFFEKKEEFPTDDFGVIVEDNAEEYIVMNKPCISINDVNNAYPSPKGSPLHNVLMNKLKQLVKSKI